MVKRSARIDARGHRQQMKLMKLDNMPPTKEFRVKLQYLMALEIHDMLRFAAEQKLPFGSLAILRTGIETLALGLWWRFATEGRPRELQWQLFLGHWRQSSHDCQKRSEATSLSWMPPQRKNRRATFRGRFSETCSIRLHTATP
jgi:hypothetical protein